jgi:hypothetical protein
MTNDKNIFLGSTRDGNTNDQLRCPFAAAERVWPPKILVRVQNPAMEIKFSTHGTITP